MHAVVGNRKRREVGKEKLGRGKRSVDIAGNCVYSRGNL